MRFRRAWALRPMRRPCQRTRPLVLTLALATGCGSESTPARHAPVADAALWTPDGRPLTREARRFVPLAWDTTTLIAASRSDTVLLHPTFIATSPGALIVFDAGDNRVKGFDLDGRHRWSYGRRGSGPGELRSPFDLTTGSAGEFVLLDEALARLVVLDADGTGGEYVSHLPDRAASALLIADTAMVFPVHGDRFWYRMTRRGSMAGAGTLPLAFLRGLPFFARQPRTALAGSGLWAAGFVYGDGLVVGRDREVACVGALVEGQGFVTEPSPRAVLSLAALAATDSAIVVLPIGADSATRFGVLDLYSPLDCTYRHSIRLPRPRLAFAMADGVIYGIVNRPEPAIMRRRPRPVTRSRRD